MLKMLLLLLTGAICTQTTEQANSLQSAAGISSVPNVLNLKVSHELMYPPAFRNKNIPLYSMEFKEAKVYWEIFNSRTINLTRWVDRKLFPIPFTLYDWNYVKKSTANSSFYIFREKFTTNADANFSNYVIIYQQKDIIACSSVYFLPKEVNIEEYAQEFLSLVLTSNCKGIDYDALQYPVQITTPRKLNKVNSFIEATIDTESRKALVHGNPNFLMTQSEIVNGRLAGGTNYVEYLIRELALDNDSSPIGSALNHLKIKDPNARAWYLLNNWLRSSNQAKH
jgi:hypothetical protein